MFKQFLALTVALGTLFGCAGNGSNLGQSPGSGGNPSSETRGYVGTQQPGDVWSWTLGASNFSGTNETLGYIYSGSVQQLQSGFAALTIDSTNDPDVAPGSRAYAVEIPGTCLLVRPAGEERLLPIIGTGLGSNPTAETLTMNWITVPREGFDVLGDDAFGVAEFTRTEAGYDLEIEFGRIGYESGPLEIGSGGQLVEQDGRFLVLDEGQPDVVFGLQRSGVFMADFGPNAGGIIGMQVPSSPLSWSDVASVDYIGMLVRSNRSQLVQCGPGSSPGVLRGYGLFTEGAIESGVPDDFDPGVELRLGTNIANGLYTVNLRSLEEGAPDEQLFLIAGEVDGKRVMFGFGGNVDDGTYNLLLVEKGN